MHFRSILHMHYTHGHSVVTAQFDSRFTMNNVTGRILVYVTLSTLTSYSYLFCMPSYLPVHSSGSCYFLWCVYFLSCHTYTGIVVVIIYFGIVVGTCQGCHRYDTVSWVVLSLSPSIDENNQSLYLVVVYLDFLMSQSHLALDT